MRIFTPTVELPFAGHPSLGTAWVLGPGRWTQTSEGATVVVEADDAGAVMGQPTPEITEAPKALLTGSTLPGADGAEGAYRAEAGNVAHLLVPTTARLDRLRPVAGRGRRGGPEGPGDHCGPVHLAGRLDTARAGLRSRPGRLLGWRVRGSRNGLGGWAHRAACPPSLGHGRT